MSSQSSRPDLRWLEVHLLPLKVMLDVIDGLLGEPEEEVVMEEVEDAVAATTTK